MKILGIDEVGRGAIAGPLVVCGCVLKDGFEDSRLIDSKKIPEKKREALYTFIKSNSEAFSFGVVCNEVIDKINILRATKQGMQVIIGNIPKIYEKIITDAVNLKNIESPFEHPFKAEDKFQAVASASILAKVYRDELMRKMHIYYPEYNWYKNKGYGTKEHFEAIKRYGLTPLHRKTFIPREILEAAAE